MVLGFLAYNIVTIATLELGLMFHKVLEKEFFTRVRIRCYIVTVLFSILLNNFYNSFNRI